MKVYRLEFVIKSDALFGRGDGVAGEVDVEVQHDQYGCPYLGGKALKGILVNECADILDALSPSIRVRWDKAAHDLFGEPGSQTSSSAHMTVGDAQLPQDLRQAIAQEIDQEKSTLRREDVLTSLTTVRRQTALDESGVPQPHSLRTVRLIIRETCLAAELFFRVQPEEDALRLLAACIKAFRRAGTGRNRGHGRLRAELCDADGKAITQSYFEQFCKAVLA